MTMIQLTVAFVLDFLHVQREQALVVSGGLARDERAAVARALPNLPHAARRGLRGWHVLGLGERPGLAFQVFQRIDCVRVGHRRVLCGVGASGSHL